MNDISAMPELPPWAAALVVILVVWSIYWKALALWHSARAGSKGWFGAFLILNTAGILEIIYLFGVNPKSKRAR